jgi:phosphatidylserine/phosphatidylglycerophosphate/cardiolipin synthase-like enzyme
MNLIIQPRDGLAAVVSAMRSAKKQIDLAIFRCDRPEILESVEAAIKRGVRVRTLVAHTNNGGQKSLRKLEDRLIAAGAMVSRTGDDFLRYHGKLMVIDSTTLWVMCFNLTGADTARSRSFAVVTRQARHVQQALKLFEADASRQPYDAAGCDLVVSPENSRSVLTDFIRNTKRQLLIYDPKVSDPSALFVLKGLVKKGVDVRLIGKTVKAGRDVPHEPCPDRKLHARVLIRDRRAAFLGSQSLRKPELDKRREVGILVKDPAVISELVQTFEEDWSRTESGRRAERAKGHDDESRAESGSAATQ